MGTHLKHHQLQIIFMDLPDQNIERLITVLKMGNGKKIYVLLKGYMYNILASLHSKHKIHGQ